MMTDHTKNLDEVANEGLRLFRRAIEDMTQEAVSAWCRWALATGVSDRLSGLDPFPSVGILLYSLGRQNLRVWTAEQRRAVEAVLTEWTKSPCPDRATYERWDDRLVDAGVHVRPW